MKSNQYRYPFNSSITLKDITMLQIGVQTLWSTPWKENDLSKISLEINDKKYLITENDVLEFNNLNHQIGTEIKILDTENRYLIIDIAYKENED